MSDYYASEDLSKFGQIGRHAKPLADEFFKYYGMVTGTDGALSKREKALIALAVAVNEKNTVLQQSFEARALEQGATAAEVAEVNAAVQAAKAAFPGSIRGPAA